MSRKTETERAKFWEDTAKENEAESKYYQTELAKAHELLGRVIHQCSERWDTVNLTRFFPTDNLRRKRTVGNASGEKKLTHTKQ